MEVTPAAIRRAMPLRRPANPDDIVTAMARRCPPGACQMEKRDTLVEAIGTLGFKHTARLGYTMLRSAPNVMLTKATALEKLRRQQAAIEQLPPSTSSPEFNKWERDTEVAIANAFG